MELKRTVFSLNFILVLAILFLACTGFLLQGMINREGGNETYRERYNTLVSEYRKMTPEEAKAAVEAYHAYVDEQTAADPEWIVIPENWEEKTFMEQIEKQVNYLSFYPKYLKKIRTEAETIRSVSIFSEPGTFAYENTIKTAEDFGRMEGTKTDFGHDLAVTSVFLDPVADYALILLIGYLCALFLQERRQGLWEMVHVSDKGRKALALKRCAILLVASFIGSLVLIGSRFLIAGIRYQGLQEFGRSLQSIEMFYNVPYRMTVGGFLLFYLLMKTLGTFFIGLLLWVILSAVSNLSLAVVIIAAVLGVEFGLSFLAPSSILILLKYLNIFSLIRYDQIFLRYLNLPFFGGLLNGPMLVTVAVFPGVLLLAAANVWIAERKYPVGKMNRLLLLANRAAKKLESLKRPVPLLLWEGFKLYIRRGGLVILVILVFWASRMEAPFMRGSSMQDYKISRYKTQYEGQVNEDLIRKIEANVENAKNDEERANLSVFLETVRRMPEGAWILHTDPYEAIFSDNIGNIQRTAALTAILFLVLLTFCVCSQDHQAQMDALLQTSPGRDRVRRHQTALCIVNAVFVWAAVYGYEIAHTAKWYGAFRGFSAPAATIPGFEESKLSVGMLFALYYLLKLLVLISTALVIRFLSSKARTNRNALLLNLTVLILPAVLVTLKIRVAEPFSFVMPLAGVEVLDRPWVFILAILIGILFTIPRLPFSRFYDKLGS